MLLRHGEMSHLYSAFFRSIGYRTDLDLDLDLDLDQLRLITRIKIADTKKEAVCLLAVWDESQ